LSVAAVDGVAGKGRAVAQVFHTRAAKLAGLVGAVEPGYSNARADREPVAPLTELFNHSDHLMARYDGRLLWRQIALDHVEIGAADTAHLDAHEHVTLAGPGVRRPGEFERIPLNRRGGMQQASLHRRTIRFPSCAPGGA
jgi:hypothetical protein